MTRSELVAALCERLPLQTADQAVRTILDCMGSALTQGRRVEIRGFGSFSLRQHGARIGRNPRSGETVHVPAKRVAAFKPGKALRERVGEEKTLFE